jgi:hypothetical protein
MWCGDFKMFALGGAAAVVCSITLFLFLPPGASEPLLWSKNFCQFHAASRKSKRGVMSRGSASI